MSPGHHAGVRPMLLALPAFLGVVLDQALDNGAKIGSITAGLIAAIGTLWVIVSAGFSWWRGTLQIVPRTAGPYALLDVTNSSRSHVTVRAEARLTRPQGDNEERYSIQWREREEYDIPLHPRGGHHILNVAEASIPKGSLRYTSFNFLTAKLPLRGGKYSESFPREQKDSRGFTLEVLFTASPTLRGKQRRYYRLSATDEPETFAVHAQDPEEPTEDEFEAAMAATRPAPLITFKEISASEALN